MKSFEASSAKKIRRSRMVFSKKGENKVKACQNQENLAHTINKSGTHVCHLTKRSYHINYNNYNRKFLGSEKMRTVTTDHIPILVQILDDKGIGGQLRSHE